MSGPWRDLDERAAPGNRAPAPEFEPHVDEPPDETSRREMLKLLGASVALAGVAGCTRAPNEEIVPFVTQPPEQTPGIPLHYATVSVGGGYATGIVVESHEGRPTKVEGNPNHPSSLGASGALEQASVLSLYDPARARNLRAPLGAATWPAFVHAWSEGKALAPRRAHGEGLHLLLQPTGSPTTLAALAQVRTRYPRAAIHHFAARARTAAREGSMLAFGRVLEAQPAYAKAEVIVALDCDFLAEGPAWLRAARDFAQGRRVRSARDEMNRLYVAEAALTVTGGMADHRLRVRRGDVGTLARALVSELSSLDPRAKVPSTPGSLHAAWVTAVADDLRAHAGKSLVVVGDGQPAAVHVAAHVINTLLGNVGRTVSFTEPVLEGESDLGPLLAALDAKEVDTLVVLAGNPVYEAPVEADLARRIARAGQCVYLGPYENETARHASWFVPQAHALESWGDARALDGTASVVQPLIAPLYGGRTVDELLGALAGDAARSAHARVRETWRSQAGEGFDTFWAQTLHDGVIAGSAAAPVEPVLDWHGSMRKVEALQPAPGGLELSFPFDTRVVDGAYTNNPWLLELPDPMTKLTWENALLISPATAQRLGLSMEQAVDLTLGGRTVTVPVFIAPGHADDTVSLSQGFGRSGDEVLARSLGVNANQLRRTMSQGFEAGAQLVARPERVTLATTQSHGTLEGRDLLRHATLEAYRLNPAFAKRPDEPTQSLYELPLLGEQQWAMSIDLNACTGCSACVVACQAENNIPIVGKPGVLMNREMHWLRIDRYFEGTAEDPKVGVQPMLCQHCEKAPCEVVCPVNATVHSPDGLNEQVYNRCVGTRFCSNNCAWKVRRFNWFNYHELGVRDAGPDARPLHAMAMNPDVTVRQRGVMEKCTYCVQRIREQGIRAKVHAKDGEAVNAAAVVTACMQACPTEAIVFGSLTEAGSKVKALHENERDYAVLGELGTRPRTRYLAKLSNPNPKLGES